jgi:hypothetical protein
MPLPSLAKDGWTRHQEKCCKASFKGADGVVGSTSDYSVVERTTPSAPAKEASRYLINGAATPPWPRRGIALAEAVHHSTTGIHA